MLRKILPIIAAIIILANAPAALAAGAINIPQPNHAITTEYTDTHDAATFKPVINNVINILIPIVGVLALLFVMLGGFMTLTAAGNEEQVKKGREFITYALGGLVFTNLAYAIVASTTRLAVDQIEPELSNQIEDVAPYLLGIISRYLINISGAIAIILILYGAITYLTSNGDQNRIDKAKKIILYTVLGLILFFSAYTITMSISNLWLIR